MIVKRIPLLITIGACLLGLSALGSQKNPIEIPVKCLGHFHAEINLLTGDFESWGEGHGSGGKFSSYLKAIVDPVTLLLISGEGWSEAANGDRLFLTANPDGSCSIVGGTGRYEGATGMTTSTNVGEPVVSFDPETFTMTIDATQRVEGTVVFWPSPNR